MPHKIDLKDRKILYELDLHARQPATRIAKKVGLSVDAVNYRIKQLVKRKIIFKFMTLLDTAKLGLTTYKVFYRFQNTTLEDEAAIFSYLYAHPQTQLVTNAQGMFDVNINVLVKDTKELDTFLTDITTRYGLFLAERSVTILVDAYFFYRDYLLGKQSTDLRKPMFFGSIPTHLPLDETYVAILRLLAIDARTPAIVIAHALGLSADTIIYRIKRLEEAGIIQNYVMIPNQDKIGYQWYYILLQFRDVTSPFEKRFFQYAQFQPNIWFYSKMIGQWDALLGLDVKGDDELYEVLMQIKKDFAKMVKGYTILKLPTMYKFNQYPMGK